MDDRDSKIDINQQIVVQILRGRWDPSAILEARDLLEQNSIDWDYCYKLIIESALAPLVYSIIHDQGIFPPETEQKLEGAYKNNRYRNIYLYSEWKAILHRFEVVGISNILLKGAAISKEIYGDIALRPSFDLDLLVCPVDTERALEELTSLGFKTVMAERGPDSVFLYENEMALDKSGPIRTAIEIHWSLIDSPYYQHYLPMDWFWQTAREVDFFGAPTQILSPEGQLLHLCAHLALHHSGEGLLWQHDIAEVIVYYNDSLNWNELFDRAQICDLIIPTQKILNAVIAKWHLPVRSEILEQVNELQATSNELKVHGYLTADKISSGRSFLYDIRSMPDFKTRTRFIMSNLFPSPTYMKTRYQITNSLLMPFYYPYRWYLGIRSIF